MFEDLVDPATCGELTPAAMVDAIGAFHRAEAAMVAHKLTMIARLLADHEASAAAEEKTWAYDGWAAVRDQIAPAMRLSPRRASTQMRLAEGLTRLPKTAALLAAGILNIRVAETLVYRTELLLPDVQDVVDTELAAAAGGYTLLSDDDLVLAIDAVIEEHDPDAVRRYREAAQSCDVGFGKRDDATGTASIYGRVSAADAELGRRVLNALAATVCANDPRSKNELRAAAQGAVYRRQNRLVCQCGDPQCVAASLPSAVPAAVIHVLAEHGALDHVLAQLEELRQSQSTTPAVTPPSIDYEVFAREADAAEAARTPTPPAPPPWENQPTATEPEQEAATETEAAPAPEAEAAPEPKAERETEAEAATQPTAGGADCDWSHWFTTNTDTEDDTEEPPWAQHADTDSTDVEESKTSDHNTLDAEPNSSKESDRGGVDHPDVTGPSADTTAKDDSDSDELDIAQPVPDADDESGSEASAAGDTAADDEPADDDGDDGDGDDETGDPPWGGGSAPQPPPKPRGPDTRGGATAASPGPATDRVNNAALQPDSPPGRQPLPPQAPAALTPPRRPRPAVTLGGTLIPLDQLADLLRNGATVTALPVPTAAPSAGYKFTGTTRDFIQCRDLRCRFPGCNRKAEYADIDHTIPHGDGGATHPSNGKALCREHHLAKTFGQGWSDEQLPDGIVRWTAPTGHTYVTQPTSRVLFPDWDPTTAPLPPPPPTKRRKLTPGITMPLRQRTREQDRQHHINTERDYNALQRALGKPTRRPPFS